MIGHTKNGRKGVFKMLILALKDDNEYILWLVFTIKLKRNCNFIDVESAMSTEHMTKYSDSLQSSIIQRRQNAHLLLIKR